MNKQWGANKKMYSSKGRIQTFVENFVKKFFFFFRCDLNNGFLQFETKRLHWIANFKPAFKQK